MLCNKSALINICELVSNFVYLILIKIIFAKMFLMALKHVLDFYTDFTKIGVPGYPQAHNNLKAKQYGQSVVMATKMVLLRREHCSLLSQHISMWDNIILTPCILGLF